MRRSLCLLVPLVLLACSHPAPKPAGERFYVSDEHGNAVVAVDPVQGRIVQTFAVGRRPRGLLLSPDGSKLYVAVSGSPIGGPGVDESKLPPPDRAADGIAVVDLKSGKVERVLQAGDDPETFAMSADGRTLFVSNEDTGAVSSVSVDGSRVTLTQPVGEEPEGAAVTPDGVHLFIACEASDYVAMLDARTLKTIKTIPIQGRPRGALMSKDGNHLYVSAESAGKLAVISTADGTLLRLIDLAKGDKTIRPMGIVEGPKGDLFVTTGRGGSVIEVDPRSGAILRSLTGVGARPWGIGITRDGKLLATANGPSGDVSLIGRTGLQVTRKIKVGDGPWGIADMSGGGAQ
jgi:YVTN family beta-propeller protein